MLVFSLVLFALLAGVQPFKMSVKPPPPPPGQPALGGEIPPLETYYQAPILLPPLSPQQQVYFSQQTRVEQQQVENYGTKGGPQLQLETKSQTATRQPTFYQQQGPLLQPQAIAYLIVRPIIQQQQYQYLEPSRTYPQQQQTVGIKGEPLRDEQLQQHRENVEIQQQQIIDQQQQQPPPPPPPQQQGEVLISKGPGKFSKLKSSIEQFAASAKAKLTLGSTYQVVSEETIQPEPQKLPEKFAVQQLPLGEVKQQHIEQTKEELIPTQQLKEEQVKEDNLIKEEPIVQQQQQQPLQEQVLIKQEQITQERQPEQQQLLINNQEQFNNEQQLVREPEVQQQQTDDKQTLQEARSKIREQIKSTASSNNQVKIEQPQQQQQQQQQLVKDESGFKRRDQSRLSGQNFDLVRSQKQS